MQYPSTFQQRRMTNTNIPPDLYMNDHNNLCHLLLVCNVLTLILKSRYFWLYKVNVYSKASCNPCHHAHVQKLGKCDFPGLFRKDLVKIAKCFILMQNFHTTELLGASPPGSHQGVAPEHRCMSLGKGEPPQSIFLGQRCNFSSRAES